MSLIKPMPEPLSINVSHHTFFSETYKSFVPISYSKVDLSYPVHIPFTSTLKFQLYSVLLFGEKNKI